MKKSRAMTFPLTDTTPPRPATATDNFVCVCMCVCTYIFCVFNDFFFPWLFYQLSMTYLTGAWCSSSSSNQEINLLDCKAVHFDSHSAKRRALSRLSSVSSLRRSSCSAASLAPCSSNRTCIFHDKDNKRIKNKLTNS